MNIWPWETLESLASDDPNSLTDGPFGSKLKSEHYTDSGVRVVRLGNLGAGDFKDEARSFVSAEHAADLQRHRLFDGDLLIAALAEPVGRCCVVPRSVLPAIVKADCIRFQPRPDLNRRFIMHWLNSPDAKKHAERHSHGVGRLRINMGAIRQIPVPVPSRFVQDTTVAAIETHFSRLDAAVAALTRAKANVKRARASVLKAAVEGRLVPTEAALSRAEGRPYEPASVLLTRILEERKARWPKGKKYVPPVAPEAGGLPHLPEGWTWATVDQLLAEDLRNGKSAQSAENGVGIRTLTLTAVTNRKFSDDNTKVTVATDQEAKGLWLEPGDLLVQRSNTPELVGSVALYQGPLNWAIYPDLLIRVRPTRHTDPAWLDVCLRSPRARRHFKSRAQGIAGSMPKISQDVISKAPVPLPPLAEQCRIVAEVDRRLSVLDALDTTLGANLGRCARLRQAILKRAFEGRLVPAEASADAPLLAAEPQPTFLAPAAR